MSKDGPDDNWSTNYCLERSGTCSPFTNIIISTINESSLFSLYSPFHVKLLPWYAWTRERHCWLLEEVKLLSANSRPNELACRTHVLKRFFKLTGAEWVNVKVKWDKFYCNMGALNVPVVVPSVKRHNNEKRSKGFRPWRGHFSYLWISVPY